MKTGLGVVQGHWKWRRSIDHIHVPGTTFYWPAIVNIALSDTVFELFDVEWYHDLVIWVRGHSRSFKPVSFESLGAVSYSPSIVTMALSCIICEIEILVENHDFFHTSLHSIPPFRGFPSEYCHPKWYGNTRMAGIPDSEKTLEDMCNRLDTIPACDRQTDGRTDILPRHSPRYAYASRGKNC